MASNPSADQTSQSTRQRISRWRNHALAKLVFNRWPPRPPAPMPSPRPRPVTPSDLLPSHPQTQSPFFDRLPLELRRHILMYAFGDRTMHMELTLDQPMLGTMIRNAAGRDAHGGFTRQRDSSSPRRWFWRSCVCHRNPPWLYPEVLWWYWNWQRPHVDRCMEGDGFNCRAWLGEHQPHCRVGALGWLRSCRRA